MKITTREKMELQEKLDVLNKRAVEMLDECGIEYGNVRSVEISFRMTNTWGLCRKKTINNQPNFYITINPYLVLKGDVEGILNTILHEYLHTCEDCFDHGSEWKRQAKKIYDKFGIEIKRVGSAEEKGFESIMETYAYVVKCTQCGGTHGYRKQTWAVKALKENPDSEKIFKCVCGCHKMQLIEN